MSAPKTSKKDEAMTTDFAPDALVLRTTGPTGKSHGGFQWPLEIGAVVECPDWKPEANCRNGLFGYLDGMGSRSNLSTDANALWWIVEVVRAECVLVENDKVKYPRAKVAYFGTFGGALARLPLAMVNAIFEQTKASKSAAATTGYRSAAATTGSGSIAAALGVHSTASAGPGGAIMLAYFDTGVWPYALRHVFASRVGENGIEAGKVYRLGSDGRPVEVGAQ